MFKKIDAFATTNSTGNPAGYININSQNSISEGEMQRIARELKGFVNEVGYACKINEETYKLRYYSSEREVEFCGHATIAIMYDLIKNTKSLRDKAAVNIITNKGQLTVENFIAGKDAVFITAPEPQFRATNIDKGEIARALNIDSENIGDKYTIRIINAGLETLIVPIKTFQLIIGILPDLEKLKQFCIENKIDIIEVFCDEVYDKDSNFRVRVFAPTFGYLEDPATGSGNSAFGYYLLENKLWEGTSLIIEQNGHPKNYNIVQLKSKVCVNNDKRILFGGSAITRVEGTYLLS